MRSCCLRSPRPTRTRGRSTSATTAPSGWEPLARDRACYRPDGRLTDLTTSNSPLADDDVRAIQRRPHDRRAVDRNRAGLNRFDPGYAPPPPPPSSAARLHASIRTRSRLSALGFAAAHRAATLRAIAARSRSRRPRVRRFAGTGNRRCGSGTDGTMAALREARASTSCASRRAAAPRSVRIAVVPLSCQRGCASAVVTRWCSSTRPRRGSALRSHRSRRHAAHRSRAVGRVRGVVPGHAPALRSRSRSTAR